MSNEFIYVVDAHFIDKIEKKKSWTQVPLIAISVVSSNHVHGEVYLIQHYVIKFVSDLWQVGGFLRFPVSINLAAMI